VRLQTSSPTTTAELADQPLSFLLQHWRTLVPIALVPTLFGVVAQVANQGMMKGIMGDPAEMSRDPMGLISRMMGFYLVLGVMGAIAVVLTIWAELAKMVAYRELLAGRSLSLFEAYKAALRLRWWLTSMVGWLIYISIGIVSLCICGLGVLYPIMALAPLTAVTVFGDEWPPDAIRRCLRVAHYRPANGAGGSSLFRIVLLLHVMLGVGLAITSVTGLPNLCVSLWYTLRGISAGLATSPAAISPPMWAVMPTLVLNGLGMGVVGSYGTILWGSFYQDQRRLMEGTDLRQALDQRLEARGA
jgi:hypothetical protein